MSGSDSGAVPKTGRKAPSLKSNTNSATGSKTGRVHPSIPIMSEKDANVQEQSTGRRRVVQEMSSTVDNSR